MFVLVAIPALLKYLLLGYSGRPTAGIYVETTSC